MGVLMISCTSNNRLSSTYSFPEGEWQRFTNPEINFQISNPGVYYDMFMELEFDISQKPDNFRISIIMNTPSGEMRSRNITLELEKARVEDGRGILKIPLRREYAFRDKGLCSFEVENRSSKMILPGMKSLTIIMEKSQ